MKLTRQTPQHKKKIPITQKNKPKKISLQRTTKRRNATKNNPKGFAYNSQLSHTSIPSDGVLIYQSNLKNYYRAMTGPTLALTALGFPGICATACALHPMNPTLALVSTIGTLGGLAIGRMMYNFGQRHVETVRLFADNTIQFQTVGSFGYRRTVKYPANYVHPINVDPRHEMLGTGIDFLPLPQEMAQTPGTIQRKKSGLVILLHASAVTGAPNTAFEQLSAGLQPFEQIEAPVNKRRIATLE